MPGLDDFFKGAASELVISTYLYPYCLLGEPDFADPYSAVEVVERVASSSCEVLITRNGGLFVRPPASLTHRADANVADIHKKIAFEDMTARLLNLVICEFTLHGVVSEPATAVHISAGRLIDDHALIISSGGGRENYLERSIQPALQLIQGTWRMTRVQPN